MLWKKCYQIEFSATLGTYGYLVTLAEPCVNDLSVLNKYITVKRLFRRLDAAVPSSAPVERLFSKDALITTTRRNRLGVGDKHFQRLLLLNAN